MLGAACTVFGACNSYDFEQEQYRKEVNLLQNSEGVYDRQVVDMADQGTEKGAVINIVAGLSGSRPSTEAYTVTIAPADSMLKAYNKSNFDIETDRYAKLLPTRCYSAPELSAQIPTGKSKVLFPFQLKNLDSLSPDSIYMLDYEINPLESAAYNNKKKHVLLRIHWRNYYASTKLRMMYNYTAAQVITVPTAVGEEASVRRPTNAVQAFPLSKNSVRFIAGDEDYGDYKKALPQINQKSIIVEVGEQLPENPQAREIRIKPYRSDEIEVIQLTPIGEYDNTFLVNEIGGLGGTNSTYYKEFRVHYKYRLLKVKQSDGSFAVGPLKEVKAKLRYQFNPRAEEL